MSEIEKNETYVPEKAGELIDISYPGVSSALSSYRKDAQKINEFIASMRQTAETAKSLWQGKASESQMGQVDQIIKWLDEFDVQYQAYISYLNDKTDNYIEEDMDISRLIDNNQDAFGQGN